MSSRTIMDGARRALVLNALKEHGPMATGQLAALLEIAEVWVVQCVADLQMEGRIRQYRDGLWRRSHV